MIRSGDLQHLLDAMIENQPWNEWQRGYYQCVQDFRDRLWRREIFAPWWRDPMLLMGAAIGAAAMAIIWLVVSAL